MCFQRANDEYILNASPTRDANPRCALPAASPRQVTVSRPATDTARGAPAGDLESELTGENPDWKGPQAPQRDLKAGLVPFSNQGTPASSTSRIAGTTSLNKSRCAPGFGWLLAAGLAAGLSAQASPRTRLLFNLGVRGEVAGNDLNSRFQFDGRGQITSMRTRLSGGRVQSEIGDLSENWDDLSFASRSFNGIKLGVPTGNLTTSFLGGTVALQDPSGRSQISPIYGLRAAWQLAPHLTLSASQLLAPAAPASQGHSLSALSLGFVPRANTRLAMELARSAGGAAWQLSARRQGAQWDARALYRDADANFSSAGNPDLIRQRSGYLAETHFKNGPFSLRGTSGRFRDGRGGREFSDGASLDFARRGLPAVSLFWDSSEQLSLPFPLPFSGDFGAQTNGEETEERRLALRPTVSQRMGVQVSQRLAATDFSLGFTRNQGRLADTPLSAQSSDRLSLSASRALGARTSARLFGALNLGSTAQSNANQSGRVLQMELGHRFAGGIGLSLGLQGQEFRAGPLRGRALVSDLGISLPLGARTSVGLQMRSTLSGSGAILAGADRLQLRFSRDFGVGRRRRSNARTPEQRRLLGRIAGRVFEDANGNNRFDVGETAVPNVSLSLQNGVLCRSDREGCFHFDDLLPRSYRVAIVGKTLPIELATLVESEVAVSAIAGQTAAIDFPAVRSGAIRGVVFEDLNRNGTRDDGEKSLADAMVQVEGSEVISFSGENGEFCLALAPGNWKISVDTDAMGGDYAMTATAPLEIRVAPGGEIAGTLLGLAPRERQVVDSFHKSQ